MIGRVSLEAGLRMASEMPSASEKAARHPFCRWMSQAECHLARRRSGMVPVGAGSFMAGRPWGSEQLEFRKDGLKARLAVLFCVRSVV